jgi:hypothetical protein
MMNDLLWVLKTSACSRPLHTTPHRQALRVHKSALHSARNFWRALLRADVAFNDMVKGLAKIEAAK